jgi:DNA-binding MarR family transcriptional regulator
MTDPPIVRFFIEVGIIEHLARTASERVLPAGLSSAGFAVLNHLTFRGPTQGPAQIAQAMQVTKGAMTGTLKRLEAQGLVTIAPDPKDGRGKAVSLTEAGAAARAAGFAALAPMFGALLQDVDATEFEAILPTLQRIRAHLDGARD